MAAKFASVDDYVAAQPPDVQRVLEEIRNRVAAAAPGVAESISYDIPTFKVGGKVVIYVGAWKNHVAVYPVPEGDAQLQHDVAPYRSGKGTLRFSRTEPFPYELLDRLVAAALGV